MDDIKPPLGESGPYRWWIRFNISRQLLPWHPVESLTVAHSVATSEMRYLATDPVCLPHSYVFGNAFSFPWLMARWLEFPRSRSNRRIGNRKAHFWRAPRQFWVGPSLRANPLQSLKDDRVGLKVAEDRWKMAVTRRDKLPVFSSLSRSPIFSNQVSCADGGVVFPLNSSRQISKQEYLYMQFQSRNQYQDNWSVLSFSLAPFHKETTMRWKKSIRERSDDSLDSPQWGALKTCCFSGYKVDAWQQVFHQWSYWWVTLQQGCDKVTALMKPKQILHRNIGRISQDPGAQDPR